MGERLDTVVPAPGQRNRQPKPTRALKLAAFGVVGVLTGVVYALLYMPFASCCLPRSQISAR